MKYVEGFVAAVPKANQAAYIALAKLAAEVFKELGATRVVECWGDDIPQGNVTDFWRAVHAKPDEAIIFSWIEYPSKAIRDRVNEQMHTDPRMLEKMDETPFDSKRMIFGGFMPILDE